MERMGRFVVRGQFIHDQECHEGLRVIFSEVVVVRAEYMYALDGIEYTAISDHFDEIEKGREVPEYDVHIDYENLSVGFTKRSGT